MGGEDVAVAGRAVIAVAAGDGNASGDAGSGGSAGSAGTGREAPELSESTESSDISLWTLARLVGDWGEEGAGGPSALCEAGGVSGGGGGMSSALERHGFVSLTTAIAGASLLVDSVDFLSAGSNALAASAAAAVVIASTDGRGEC